MFSKIFGNLKPDIVLCGSLRRKPKKQSGGLTRTMAIVFDFGGNINRPISYEIIEMVIRFNYYILWTSGRFRCFWRFSSTCFVVKRADVYGDTCKTLDVTSSSSHECSGDNTPPFCFHTATELSTAVAVGKSTLTLWACSVGRCTAGIEVITANR